MNLDQIRRTERLCRTLDLAPELPVATRVLYDEPLTILHEAREATIDGRFDSVLESAIVDVRAMLDHLRGRSGEQERRGAPRYTFAGSVPVLVSHRYEPVGRYEVGDIGRGGLRLVASKGAVLERLVRVGAPVSVVATDSDEARDAGLGRATMYGDVVGMDASGATLHVRFDRGRGVDWGVVDQWIRRLVLRTSEGE